MLSVVNGTNKGIEGDDLGGKLLSSIQTPLSQEINFVSNKNDIDSFVDMIKTVNINYCFKYGATDQLFLIKNTDDKKQDIVIPYDDKLGGGKYGTAFKINNFVIKFPMINLMLKEFILKEPFADYDRCSGILNTVNKDENFSRSVTFDNGQHALVTIYIDGESVTGDKAIQFVKSRGYIIHDFNSEGNVRVKDGKLVLIDADNVTRPYKERRNSIGSEFFYSQYPGKIRNG